MKLAKLVKFHVREDHLSSALVTDCTLHLSLHEPLHQPKVTHRITRWDFDGASSEGSNVSAGACGSKIVEVQNGTSNLEMMSIHLHQSKHLHTPS